MLNNSSSDKNSNKEINIQSHNSCTAQTVNKLANRHN